jgi:hypothetical protein
MKFNEAILKGLNIHLSGAVGLFVYAPLGSYFWVGNSRRIPVQGGQVSDCKKCERKGLMLI